MTEEQTHLFVPAQAQKWRVGHRALVNDRTVLFVPA